MGQYKLTYFDLRIRGEFIRYMFNYANTPFNDERVAVPDWIKSIKATTELGKLPVLTTPEGKSLSNSIAIGGYLAAKLGLAGKDDIEAAYCNMIAAAAEEMLAITPPFVRALLFAQDKIKAAEVFKELTPRLLTYLETLERLLKENGSGWFVGKQLTWADFHVGHATTLLETYGDSAILAKFPALKAHTKKLHELAAVKKVVANRKPTPI